VDDDLKRTTSSETELERHKKTAAAGRGQIGKWLLLGLHWLIILNFLVEIAYAGYMVFVIMAPESGAGPLWGRAKGYPFELMSVRRMYAIEAWLAIGGLSIYLAITEIGPRLRRMYQDTPSD